MPKLRVESFTISLDGFGAGPDQDVNNPLGSEGHIGSEGQVFCYHIQLRLSPKLSTHHLLLNK
jgi:hypothetical protein